MSKILRAKIVSPPLPCQRVRISSLNSGMVQRMVNALDEIGDHIGVTSAVRSVELYQGIRVEVFLPKLALAMRVDSLSLQEGLYRICKGVFPPLWAALSKNKADLSSYIGRYDELVCGYGHEVAVMVATAEKILTLQGWQYIPAVEAWQAPVYIGDGFLISESDLCLEFLNFLKHRDNVKKLVLRGQS